MSASLGIKDMTGKEIQTGHLVAVRYSWNSYLGIAKTRGLVADGRGGLRHAFFSPHQYDTEATYQIIGHEDEKHPDFNRDVWNWYTTENKIEDESRCPVKITIYDNMAWPHSNPQEQ